MKNALIVIFVGLIMMASCGGTDETPTKIVAAQPKFQNGQIVYILGEYPAYVKSSTYQDSAFDYTLTVYSTGSASDYNWKEDMLRSFKTGGDAVSVINRDTTYHEQIVDVHDNTLSSQEQWVDYSFKNTEITLAGFLQEAHGDIEADQSYGASGVYGRIKAIDSVFKKDIYNMSINMKAGKYPSGK